jgi:AcrR family transcriptional regulator
VNVIHESELSPRRQRRRRQRREEILDTAMELLAADGFDALTMQRLARELDCAPGALYRYFAGKDALVVELQARAVQRFAEDLATQRAGWQSDTPSDPAVAALGQLLGVARFYLALRRLDARRFRLVSITMADPRTLVADEAAGALVAPLSELLAAVAELFAAAARAGALTRGDAKRRTLGFWAALHGATLLGKLERLSPEHLAVAELGHDIARAMLAGWGADQGKLKRAARWLDKHPPATSQETDA